MLHAERLRELFEYDPLTGLFRWRAQIGRRSREWFSGYANSTGYFQLVVDRRRYCAHRLAWLYVHGEWPEDELDHINGNQGDNRISNLRQATRGQNAANARSFGKTGLKGVYSHHCKWRACIWIGGRPVHLGLFATADEAAAAYQSKARQLHGEFAYDPHARKAYNAARK